MTHEPPHIPSADGDHPPEFDGAGPPPAARTPEPSSLVGKTVGNYEIQRELGRGGMGVVYKAHEQSLQRVVALKVLLAHLARDTAFVKRFLHEARAVARLNHPNVVTIHTVGQHGGTYYIAMEYVKGRSLAEIIRAEGQIDVRRALDIAAQSAKALAEAHKQGIIHRDIKPHNIMVDEAGLVKVMDFGLARAAQSSTHLTATGAQLGTPRYMSPEQCQGKPLDPRTDVFSLGVTLYEMLAGSPPFDADTPLALMYQILHEPFPAVQELNADVPAGVAQVLARMTARDPDQRYPSAAVLCADLKALTHEVPAARAPRAASKCAVKWTVAAVVGVAILMGVLAATFLFA